MPGLPRQPPLPDPSSAKIHPSMLPHFYYHPRMMQYDFGPRHPLKPVRLARTIHCLDALLQAQTGRPLEPTDPGLANPEDVARVHDQDFIEVVQALGAGEKLPPEVLFTYGFSNVDTPPFPGMYAASLAYCGGAVAAAQAVNQGAPLAFNIAGGLHHAQRFKASGFCVFDDPAISCHILRERFGRVLYVDIDLHHGDGVEAIFSADEEIATLSIHQTGRTIYPGSGFVTDTGLAGSAFNIPLEPRTTGDTWLWAFSEILPRVADRHQPRAVVLQMGCDPHTTDPLGHLQVSVQEWLAAVALVRDLGLPVVACGGGGYDLANVPRMWAAACLTLARIPVPDRMPPDVPLEWGCSSLADADLPTPRHQGRAEAEAVVETLVDRLHNRFA